MLEVLLMILEVYCQYQNRITLQSTAEVSVLFSFIYDSLSGFAWLSSEKWVSGMVARIKEQLIKNYKIDELEAKFQIKFDMFLVGMLANLFANQFSSPRSFSEFFDVLILFLNSDRLPDFIVATGIAVYAAKRHNFETCDTLLEVDFVFKMKFFSGWQVNKTTISVLKEVHHVNFIKLFQ